MRPGCPFWDCCEDSASGTVSLKLALWDASASVGGTVFCCRATAVPATTANATPRNASDRRIHGIIHLSDVNCLGLIFELDGLSGAHFAKVRLFTYPRSRPTSSRRPADQATVSGPSSCPRPRSHSPPGEWSFHIDRSVEEEAGDPPYRLFAADIPLPPE